LAVKSRTASKDVLDAETLRSSGSIPAHIAIIMDGNGRWAKSKGMPRAYGHREGVRSVREIVEACGELGVKYLTLYAFSTENWKRPMDEVSMLMGLLVNTLHKELNNLHSNNVHLITMGDLGKLPKNAQQELHEAVLKTRNNTGLTLNLALSYSGRWDLVRAIRSISGEIRRGKISPEDVDEILVKAHLSTAAIPDPDLLIRTSGEMRISNFLLWELAYTEIFICPDFWPAFRRPHLYQAIASFQTRERRFGQVSEQVRTKNKRSTMHKEQSANAIHSL
jgi:undecaprenyl diphosphate synthase